MKFLALFLLLGSSALAVEAPPSVTLTQDQLTRLLQAERASASARSVSDYITQAEAAKAKDVYEAIQQAFKPAPKEPPTK